MNFGGRNCGKRAMQEKALAKLLARALASGAQGITLATPTGIELIGRKRMWQLRLALWQRNRVERFRDNRQHSRPRANHLRVVK